MISFSSKTFMLREVFCKSPEFATIEIKHRFGPQGTSACAKPREESEEGAEPLASYGV